MTIGDLIRSRPVPLLYGLMFVSLVALLPLPPLLQNQDYHQFADQRELFGIPNFWNVVSNLPFIAIGAVGLLRFHRNPIALVLFAGVFLTGFGSSFYHLNPNDSTLFWDRLPMTLCFAAILSAVVEERVDARAGVMLLRPLLAIGIFSLLLWRWTDDLRLYAWAQFFPFAVLVLILQFFPPKFTGASYWAAAAALYALAKLLEFLDEQIYSIGTIVSGHTLKHLAAAAASFAVLRLMHTPADRGIALISVVMTDGPRKHPLPIPSLDIKSRHFGTSLTYVKWRKVPACSLSRPPFRSTQAPSFDKK